jgi:hypothetical protein
VIEIIVSIGIIFGILLILYWRIMWRLRVDERVSFWFVEFMPVKMLLNNRGLFKMLKKEAGKE